MQTDLNFYYLLYLHQRFIFKFNFFIFRTCILNRIIFNQIHICSLVTVFLIFGLALCENFFRIRIHILAFIPTLIVGRSMTNQTFMCTHFPALSLTLTLDCFRIELSMCLHISALFLILILDSLNLNHRFMGIHILALIVIRNYSTFDHNFISCFIIFRIFPLFNFSVFTCTHLFTFSTFHLSTNFAFTPTFLLTYFLNLAPSPFLSPFFNQFCNKYILICSRSGIDYNSLFILVRRSLFQTIFMAMSDGWGVGGDCTSGHGNLPTIKGTLNGSHAASCGVKTSVQHLGCGIFSAPVCSAYANNPTCLLDIHNPNLNFSQIIKIHP